MIYVELMGGLGNQCFQIAHGYSVAKRLDTDFTVVLVPERKRQFHEAPLKYFNSLFSKVKVARSFPRSAQQISEPYFPNDVVMPNITKKDAILTGYFQGMDLWEDENEIRALFSVPSFAPRITQATAVHVRGGDYLNAPAIYGVCGKPYYDKIPADDRPRCLFTDDLPYAKSLQITYDQHVVKKSVLDEFLYLSRFDTIFMGNSTFAWWAAFLGEAETVYYPKIWTGPAAYGWSGPRNKAWIAV